ncbi:hypothetical protein AAG570_002329 [Ranatra chinensis]|uniref:Uncharacterized protein n=1 Tax=Ranatra chinensis TaxID=642074 RepID=A0ABD0Y7M4_9HEMI
MGDSKPLVYVYYRVYANKLLGETDMLAVLHGREEGLDGITDKDTELAVECWEQGKVKLETSCGRGTETSPIREGIPTGYGNRPRGLDNRAVSLVDQTLLSNGKCIPVQGGWT